MLFARDFLDLQLSFAEHVAKISDVPLPSALFGYTNLYVRLGLGRHFDRQHIGWRAYLAGVADAASIRAFTQASYLHNAEANTLPAVEASFGCFSYALSAPAQAKLHFRNMDAAAASPLASAQQQLRHAELRALLLHLKQAQGASCMLVGSSWLYNLNAYTRLFPAAYTSNTPEVPGRFQSMSLWGQFVDHTGRLKAPLAATFLASLAQCTHVNELDACFPFQVRSAQAPVQCLFDFYGL